MQPGFEGSRQGGTSRSPVTVLALAFLAGVVFIVHLSALPGAWWWLPPAGGVLMVARFGRWRWDRGIFLAVMAALAGAGWTTYLGQARLQQSLDPALEGVDLIIQTRVASLPRQNGRGLRFVADRVTSVEGYSLPPRLLLNWYGERRPRAGELWRMTVRLKRAHGLQNPGGFDYEGWLFGQGIRATGYVRRAPAAERLGALAPGMGSYLLAWRQELAEGIARVLTRDPRAGILQALVVGDRGGISADQWRLINQLGLNHLVAISGLHIALVGGLAGLLAAWFWRLVPRLPLSLPAPQAGIVGGLLAAGVYAALAGFGIPARRALLMVALVGLLWLRRRRAPWFQILAAALFLVLVADPFAVLSGGFWLSFAAVGAIAWGSGHTQGSASGISGYLGKLLKVQWVVWLGLLPLLLVLYQRAPLLALPANLLAVPVVGLLVVPVLLVGALLLPILPAPASVLLGLAAWMLALLWQALQGLAGLGNWVLQVSPPWWSLFPAAVGVGLLLAPRGWPGRKLGLLWCLPLLSGFLGQTLPWGTLFAGTTGNHLEPGGYRLTVLDAGQGLATVVRTAHHALVYDTGARYSERFGIGADVLAPWLRRQRVARVDRLLLSNADADHAGGAAGLLALVPVTQIASGEAAVVAGRLGRAVAPCVAGQAWHWDEVRFSVIWPPPAYACRSKPNRCSCVLRVDGAGGSVLLPGDIDRQVEGQLLGALTDEAPLALLVAPHHGSADGSSARFIAATRPERVVFSSGYRNRYRHPSATVLARYKAAGVRRFTTAEAGAVELLVPASGAIEINTARGLHRRFWHWPAPW